MKVVYTLVSSQSDYYLEQFCYSAFSVKRVSPNAEITLVVDEQTNRSFVGVRETEASIADEIISVSYPENMTSKQRSRMLKTTLREIIRGDYLFMDVDTIVLSPVEELLSEVGELDIYGVQDLNAVEFSESPDYDYIINLTKKAFNFPIEKEADYFNSGVLFVKDNQRARIFYRAWNDNYISGCAKGVSFDQPAFAYTNYKMNHIVGKLTSGWNCQICACDLPQFLNAKIIHYFSGNSNLAVSVMNRPAFFETIKNNGTLSEEQKDILVYPVKSFYTTPKLVSNERDIRLQRTLIYRLSRKMQNTFAFAALEAFLQAIRHIKLKKL